MGDAAKGCLDAADHDGLGVLEGLAHETRVHEDGAVGAAVVHAARGEVVVVAALSGGGVVRDHRVHASGRDAPPQAGLAQTLDVLRAVPTRLRDHAHAVASLHQHLAQHGRSAEGAVEVGVPGDQDHIEFAPAKLSHLFTRHRQVHRRNLPPQACERAGCEVSTADVEVRRTGASRLRRERAACQAKASPGSWACRPASLAHELNT